MQKKLTQKTLKSTTTGPAYLHRRCNNLSARGEYVGREFVRLQVKRHDRAEDLRHGVVVELQRRDEVEVTQKSGGHRVSGSARRPHGRQEYDVDQRHFGGVFQIVPWLDKKKMRPIEVPKKVRKTYYSSLKE